MNNIRKWFHALVLSVTIIHISICSYVFDGTAIWNELTYLCEFLFIVVLFQYVNSVHSLNKIEVLSIVYFVFLLFVSLLYGLPASNLKALIGRSLEVATVLMLFRLNQNDLRPLLLSAAITLSIVVYINAYYLTIFPNGIPHINSESPYYFIGTNYNQIGPKVIMAFMFTAILCERYKIFFLNIVLLSAIGLWSLFTVGSMTSVVSLIILLFVMINSWSIKLNKFIAFSLCVFIVLFQILVVFIGSSISGKSGVISFLDLIGKDITFTGRTFLWAYSRDYFWDSPLWGHGYVNPTDYAQSGFFHGIAKGSHNYIYYTLHKGGIILLLLVYKLFKSGYLRLKRYLKFRSAYVVVFTVIIFFLMMLFEYYEVMFIYFLILLMYYYPNIHKTILEQR